MNIHDYAQKATATTNNNTRPIRKIRGAMKDEAFASTIDQIRTRLNDGAIHADGANYTVTNADAAHVIRMVYNAFYGPTKTLDDESALKVVESWSDDADG